MAAEDQEKGLLTRQIEELWTQFPDATTIRISGDEPEPVYDKSNGKGNGKDHSETEDLEEYEDLLRMRDITPPAPPPTTSSVQILEALRHKAPWMAVDSPGGSGKTYSLAVRVGELLDAGVWVLVVLADKSAIVEFKAELVKVLGKTDIALGLYSFDVDSQKDLPAPWDPAWNGVITHGHYISRKGHTRHWRKLMRQIAYAMEPTINPGAALDGAEKIQMQEWAQRPREVLIDEADQYLHLQVIQMTLDARFLPANAQGAKRFSKIKTYCPARAGKNVKWCERCDLRQNVLVQHSVREHNSVLMEPGDTRIPMVQARRIPIEVALAGTQPGPQFQYGVFRWQHLMPNEVVTVDPVDYLRYIDKEDKDRLGVVEEEYDDLEALREFLRTAHLVRIVQAFPYFNGRQIASQEILDKEWKEEELDALEFPYYMCQVRHLIAGDRMALWWLWRYFPRVRLLSATWDAWSLDLLQASVGQIPRVQCQVQERLIDQTLVLDTVFTVGRRWLERFAGIEGVKTLAFYSTAARMEVHENRTRGKPNISFYGQSELRRSAQIVNSKSRHTDAEVELLISYVRSSIGRGVNLGEYEIVVLDMAAHSPTQFTVMPMEGEREPKEVVLEQRDQLVAQAGLRVFRRAGDKEVQRRVVILVNPDMEWLGTKKVPVKASQRLLDRFRVRTVEGGFSVLEVTSGKDSIPELAAQFIETGEVKPPEQKTSVLSRKQRASKPKQDFREKLITALEEKRKAGVSWRDVRTNHGKLYQKLTKEEQENLKANYLDLELPLSLNALLAPLDLRRVCGLLD